MNLPLSLLITGATGHLGRLVVEQLQVRAVDFGDPAAVRAAVAGADHQATEQLLRDSGVPDTAAAHGALCTASGDLAALTGRRPPR